VLFADFPGIPEKKALMIFPAIEAGKILRETYVTHVPMRDLRPARLRICGRLRFN
jgi:hypothetical protein